MESIVYAAVYLLHKHPCLPGLKWFRKQNLTILFILKHMKINVMIIYTDTPHQPQKHTHKPYMHALMHTNKLVRACVRMIRQKLLPSHVLNYMFWLLGGHRRECQKLGYHNQPIKMPVYTIVLLEQKNKCTPQTFPIVAKAHQTNSVK